MVLNGNLLIAQHSNTICQLHRNNTLQLSPRNKRGATSENDASCPVIRAQLGNHATPTEGCGTAWILQQQCVRVNQEHVGGEMPDARTQHASVKALGKALAAQPCPLTLSRRIPVHPLYAFQCCLVPTALHP